jgi:hypothetical protein
MGHVCDRLMLIVEVPLLPLLLPLSPLLLLALWLLLLLVLPPHAAPLCCDSGSVLDALLLLIFICESSLFS